LGFMCCSELENSCVVLNLKTIEQLRAIYDNADAMSTLFFSGPSLHLYLTRGA
jgi:hypothetical protein